MRIRQYLNRTTAFAHRSALLVCGLFLFITASAAEKPITGKVVDKDGQPLIGVTVTIKGNYQKGAATNADGDFLITVSPNDICVFSFLGFWKTR